MRIRGNCQQYRCLRKEASSKLVDAGTGAVWKLKRFSLGTLRPAWRSLRFVFVFQSYRKARQGFRKEREANCTITRRTFQLTLRQLRNSLTKLLNPAVARTPPALPPVIPGPDASSRYPDSPEGSWQVARCSMRRKTSLRSELLKCLADFLHTD